MKRLLLIGSLLAASPAGAYPTDEAAQQLTQIRRLKWQHDIDQGARRGRKTPMGARWKMADIELRLEGIDLEITPETPRDPALQKGLEALLKKWKFRRYNVALLDITNPKAPRYAAHQETVKQTPGSVAKLLLAGAMLGALKERFPDDFKRRQALLRETMVSADGWAMPNHHEVPVITGDLSGTDYKSWIRAVRVGDTFSLWEWMDHALSPSSNASASMLWREATLLRLLGDKYPPAKYDAALFDQWDRDTFTKAAFDAVDAPLVDAGLDVDDFYIRMFFTRGAGRHIRSEASRASPLGLLRWMIRVEQGRMVDRASSLELKRMIYLTRKRIRYAKSPALRDSAVFFKTGSLYKCKPEEGYKCTAYMGNVVNVLNGIILVETPAVSATDEAPATVEPLKAAYMVAVMSNELRRSAADDHTRLATDIHELVLSTMPEAP